MTAGVEGLPPLTWVPVRGHFSHADTGGALKLAAEAGVDWSNDSLGGPHQHLAAALTFPAPDTMSLSARVSVESPRTTFDAAALVLWADQDHWAKLCFEYSPQGESTVVSVVTNNYSDDCNSTPVPGQFVHLRICRMGSAWAFHSSLNGSDWAFVRLFRLHTDLPVQVGFMSQAPLGDTCMSSFDNITFALTAPVGLRDGS